MRVCTLWIILLAVALSLGSDPLVQSTARAAWARTAAPRPTPRRHQAPAPHLRVTVTAYSHTGHTASGRRVRPGIVALSRDVEQALGVTFGAPVVLEGLGTFVFDDRMAARHRRRVDIFVASPQAARRFGVTVAEVRVAGAHARGLPPCRMVKISEGSYLLLVMARPAVSLSGGDTTMYSVMSHETRRPGTLSAGFAIR